MRQLFSHLRMHGLFSRRHAEYLEAPVRVVHLLYGPCQMGQLEAIEHGLLIEYDPLDAGIAQGSQTCVQRKVDELCF